MFRDISVLMQQYAGAIKPQRIELSFFGRKLKVIKIVNINTSVDLSLPLTVVLSTFMQNDEPVIGSHIQVCVWMCNIFAELEMSMFR